MRGHRNRNFPVISIPILLLLLLLHCLGEFIIRPRVLAFKDLKWRALHSWSYATIVTVGYGVAQWMVGISGYAWPTPAWMFFPSIMLLHFMCNMLTMPYLSHYLRTDQPYFFFLVLGLDQLLHQACLICTFDTLTRLWQ